MYEDAYENECVPWTITPYLMGGCRPFLPNFGGLVEDSWKIHKKTGKIESFVITRVHVSSITVSKTYVSKIVWFWYDYGVMVWKWYDWMIVVWWFVSCVCEGVQLKKLQTVVNKVHTLFSRFLQTPKYHTKHFLKFSVFATFSFHDMTWELPEDLWRPVH